MVPLPDLVWEGEEEGRAREKKRLSGRRRSRPPPPPSPPRRSRPVFPTTVGRRALAPSVVPIAFPYSGVVGGGGKRIPGTFGGGRGGEKYGEGGRGEPTKDGTEKKKKPTKRRRKGPFTPPFPPTYKAPPPPLSAIAPDPRKKERKKECRFTFLKRKSLKKKRSPTKNWSLLPPLSHGSHYVHPIGFLCVKKTQKSRVQKSAVKTCHQPPNK